MRRVLIVAYYFPPIGGIGSIRLARFAACLPEFGWEPTVLAPAATPHATDPNRRFPEDKVIRSRSIELSRLGRVVPGAGGAAGEPGAAAETARQALRRTLRVAAHRFVFYPDGQIGWYPAAVAAGLRASRARPFDLIYSSSNPITAHLVARTLVRRTRLPWVAEFRDPWSDRLPSDHPYRSHAASLMTDLARGATRVVVPTPGMAEYYGERWGRRVDLVMNGHDLEAPSREPPDRPTITHVGTYYPGRQDFRALWAALAGLSKARASDLPRIRFVGELPDEVREETAAFGLSELVEATGFVSHEEAMRAMMSSTVLIASGFAGDDPVSRGVIPAKVFEYLASGLPIIYLGNPTDDAARLLSGQPGCHVLESDDVSGARAALESELDGRTYQRDVERFSRRARARDLAGILNEAAATAG